MKKSTSLATMEGIFGASVSSFASRAGRSSSRRSQRVLKETKSLDGATKALNNKAVAKADSSVSADDESISTKRDTHLQMASRKGASGIPTDVERQNPCPFPSDSFSTRHKKNEKMSMLSRSSPNLARVSSSDRLSWTSKPVSSQQLPTMIRTAKSEQLMGDESGASMCSDMSTSTRFSSMIRRGANRRLQGLSQSELFMFNAQRPKPSSSSSSSSKKNAQWTSNKGNATSTSDLYKVIARGEKKSSLGNNSCVHVTTSAAASCRLLGDASMDSSAMSTSSRLFSSNR
jgi:hypothetical protein